MNYYIDVNAIGGDTAGERLSLMKEAVHRRSPEVTVIIEDTLKANNITIREISNQVGYTNSTVSKCFNAAKKYPNGTRFYVGMQLYTHFVKTYYNDSLHKLFYGVDKIIELPNKLSTLLACLDRLPDFTKDYIVALTVKMRAEEDKNNVNVSDFYMDVLRDRILEIAANEYVEPHTIFSARNGGISIRSTKYSVHQNFRVLMTKILGEPNYTAATASLIALSMELNLSCDYLYIRDYTKSSTVGIRGDQGSVTPILDENLLRFLSSFLNLSPEGQAKIETIIWQETIAA